MAGVDKCHNDKEIRKRKRETEAETRRLHARDQEKANQELASPPEMTDSNDSSLNDEFPVLSTSTNMKKPKKIINVFTENVVTSLDRVNLSDRNAMIVVVAQALGTPISDISLSRSTIRRYRNQIRQTIAETDKASFSSQLPLVLYWDNKLLPNIVG